MPIIFQDGNHKLTFIDLIKMMFKKKEKTKKESINDKAERSSGNPESSSDLSGKDSKKI